MKPIPRECNNKRPPSTSSPVVAKTPVSHVTSQSADSLVQNVNPQLASVTPISDLIVDAFKNPDVALNIGKIIAPYILQNLESQFDMVKSLQDENAFLKEQLRELSEINKNLIMGSKISDNFGGLSRRNAAKNFNLPASQIHKPPVSHSINQMSCLIDSNAQISVAPPVNCMSALVGGSVEKSVIQASSNQWQTAKAKKHKKVIGKGAISEKVKSAKPFQSVARKAVLHVDNITDDVTESDIMKYASDNGVTVFSCFIKRSWVPLREDDDYEIKAFRLCIDINDKEKCFGEDFWPEGVIIREWKWKGEVNNKLNPKSDKQPTISGTNEHLSELQPNAGAPESQTDH